MRPANDRSTPVRARTTSSQASETQPNATGSPGALELGAPRDLLEQIAIYANGDARTAYNILESAAGVAREGLLDRDVVESVIERKVLLYDKAGEEHFNLISALHKSVRSSDADAALEPRGFTARRHYGTSAPACPAPRR